MQQALQPHHSLNVAEKPMKLKLSALQPQTTSNSASKLIAADFSDQTYLFLQ